MQMAPTTRNLAGIVALILMGLVYTGMMVTGRILKSEHWPFYRLAAGGTLLTALFLIAYGCLARVPLPPRRVAVWVLFRGLASPGSIVCATMAARTGCSPGDVSALNSVNMLAGALLGFLFLGEPVHIKHGIAIVCSIVGAVLISKPEFLFDSQGRHPVPAISYILALLSGCSQACIALCSRKAGPISIVWPTVSACLQSTIVYCVLAGTGIIDDFTLEPIAEHPLPALGLFAIVFALTAGTVCLTSCGTQWCPAAISTVIFSASSMVWGYGAQVIIFRKALQVVTVIGAVFMLAGVLISTCWRSPAPAPEIPNEENPLGEMAKSTLEVHIDEETGEEAHDSFETFDDLASDSSAAGDLSVRSWPCPKSPISHMTTISTPSHIPAQIVGSEAV